MKNFNLNNLTTEELILLQSQVAIELAKRNDNDKYIASTNIQFDLVYNIINNNTKLQDYYGLCMFAEDDEIKVVINDNEYYYIKRGHYYNDTLDNLLEIKDIIKNVIMDNFFINTLKLYVGKYGTETDLGEKFITFLQIACNKFIDIITNEDDNEEFFLIENEIETPITEELAQQLLIEMEVI